MANNKTLITAFSLTPKTEKVLNTLQQRSGKTRSEIVRNLIDSQTKRPKIPAISGVGEPLIRNLHPDDANQILKFYYQLISSQTPKPTIVIGIAVISRRDRVLIGLRKAKDRDVRNLSWTFPTGKFNSLDFETELIKTIRRETNLTGKITRLVHARLIPDSPAKKVRIVALYYHCRASADALKPGGDFKSVKWVPAVDVTTYFTTSVADEIMNFLGTL